MRWAREQGRDEKCLQMRQWALTQGQTLWGRRAPEAFDLRLREDFHELEHARHVRAVVGEGVLA